MSQPTVQPKTAPDRQAYDRNLPCLNPNCKSHGQPHPNCRCYGMAEGGVVGHFCASNKPHEPSCAYSMAQGEAIPSPVQSMQPRATQGPLMGYNEPSPMDALAHGGAGMLFGPQNSPYFSAFGSGSNSRLQSIVPPGSEGSVNAVNYLAKVKRGSAAIDKEVASLFGQHKGAEQPPMTDKETKLIKDYVEQGGLNQELQDQTQQQAQPMAEGGEVVQSTGRREDPLSTMLPSHNLVLNSAKARVSHYLNGIRPQEIQSKLPFDSKKSTKAQDKEYDRAVELAGRPLSVLGHIKQGNLTPTTMKHFGSMWPELHDHLSKKMTEEITKAQLEDRKPNYKSRQAMSLFMGAELDSTMTPSSIMAAQNVFANKALQQQQAPTKNKKGTSTLSKTSKEYETASQAAEARQKQ